MRGDGVSQTTFVPNVAFKISAASNEMAKARRASQRRGVVVKATTRVEYSNEIKRSLIGEIMRRQTIVYVANNISARTASVMAARRGA